MSDTPFKTPLPYRQKGNNSDSGESTTSSFEMGDDISIVTLYDDFYRLVKQRLAERENLEATFLTSMEEMKILFLHWKKSLEECQRLQDMLNCKIEQNSELERNLSKARNMLDEERRKRKLVGHELQSEKNKIREVLRIISKDQHSKLNAELKNTLASFHCGRKSLADQNRPSTDREGNMTGSILSELGYSRSEDDLDNSKHMKPSRTWKKPRLSEEVPENEPVAKKRRSQSSKVVEIGESETVRATTTLTVVKEGSVTATSVIESVPKAGSNKGPCVVESNVPSNLVFESWSRQDGTPTLRTSNYNLRQHYLQPRSVMLPEICFACEKRIGFGRSVLRCKECKLHCHPECRAIVTVPCVPSVNTPNYKKAKGTVSDYTPTTPPMVPAIVVQCIHEIEQRGLTELGIYRIPGAEKDVKSLKEKLLCARTPVNLKDVDIHTICGCLKDFLRSLTEPLVTTLLWKEFVQAVKATDRQDVAPVLYQTISELPQPNRDTLACIILHLQKVCQSPECKMPINNIAKIFGPTLIGYSSEDLNHDQLIDETRSLMRVMEHLLNIPSDFWAGFMNVPAGRIQHTPSTDSLLRQTATRFFTPTFKSNQYLKKKEDRLFHTPPTYK